VEVELALDEDATGFLSSAAFASCAARSTNQAGFPLPLDRALRETIEEIQERPESASPQP
jgi:hypothetical protein